MKVALVLLLALLVPVVVVAQEKSEEAAAAAEVEKAFTKGRIAEKEGRFEEAVTAYRTVVGEWPDDKEFTPKAWIHLVTCLRHLRMEREAERVSRLALGKYAGDEEFGRMMRAAFAAPVEPPKSPDEGKGFDRRMEELRRVWAEEGVGQEEIERRIERVRAEHEAEMAARRRIAEEEARLREEGVEGEEFDRRMAELREEVRRNHERRFRQDHERGMEGARGEFLRLAGRLGIPPEAAERLLEEHRRGGPERQFRRIREFEEAIDHLGKAVREAHERIERGERAIEQVGRNLGRIGEEGEHALGRIHRHLEELSERVERLERRLDEAQEKLVPFLKDLQERVGRLEERVGGEEKEK